MESKRLQTDQIDWLVWFTPFPASKSNYIPISYTHPLPPSPVCPPIQVHVQVQYRTEICDAWGRIIAASIDLLSPQNDHQKLISSHRRILS